MQLLRRAYDRSKEAYPGALVGLQLSTGYHFFYDDAITVEAITGIRLNRQKPPGIRISTQHLPLLWRWGYTIVSLDRESTGNG